VENRTDAKIRALEAKLAGMKESTFATDEKGAEASTSKLSPAPFSAGLPARPSSTYEPVLSSVLKGKMKQPDMEDTAAPIALSLPVAQQERVQGEESRYADV